MQIEIAERLKPFSHTPDTSLILPGTAYRLQVFPAGFIVDDLSNAVPRLLAQVWLDIQGPLEQFTVEQDLEKGQMRVWGKSKAGFIRYHLKALANADGIVMGMEKTPQHGVAFKIQGEWTVTNLAPLQAGDQRLLTGSVAGNLESPIYQVPLIDRLSLGNHKSQDWELIRRRRNFAEILPIWHRLGQLIPQQTETAGIGALALIADCRQAIAASAPEHILSHFERLFLAGFESALVPRLFDTDHQGLLSTDLALASNEMAASPLQLLSLGSTLIRSLFIQWHADTLSLLPACPPEFHCGRLINVLCGQLGSVNLEWTKKAIRCVTFTAVRSQTIIISSRYGQSRCRVRTSYKDRGKPYQLGTPFEVHADQNYWFDNFMA